ncbi:hypothetical protein FGK63_20415 [Ruegeria sediminis]|uniref:Uncharacterized protein n=1 Tax=Ruegeria sediminis TaxID=2583820 RepID=A0ABY2WS34_9RHOB|nr:hypothetical protein [Ruegeria sediminis]TMV02594.1 hypothetical protein FGK63_20415 [Ruegeria sediminis]
MSIKYQQAILLMKSQAEPFKKRSKLGLYLSQGKMLSSTATIQATGEVRDGRVAMKLLPPLEHQEIEIETNADFDPEDLFEAALFTSEQARKRLGLWRIWSVRRAVCRYVSNHAATRQNLPH